MRLLKTNLSVVLIVAAFTVLAACDASSDPADPDVNPGLADTVGDTGEAEEDVYVPIGEPEWSLVDVGQGETTGFYGIHGAVVDGGYVVGVVGTDASVFVYDSATGVWDPRPAGEARDLNAIWVEDLDTMYIGGDSGILRRWDPTAGTTGDWIDESIPDLGDLAANLEILDMWGDREVAQYICGSEGFIGHWDNTNDRWVPDFFPGAELTEGRKLESVWGTGPDDVWVVGNRIVLHWNGIEWDVTSFEEESQHFHGVWTSDAGTVFAVADQGKIWTLDRANGATEWSDETPTRLTQLNAWGLDADSVFSVGWNSTMLRWDGQAWDYETLKTKPGTPEDLQIPGNLKLSGLWGTTGDNLYVIAEEGLLVRWGPAEIGD